MCDSGGREVCVVLAVPRGEALLTNLSTNAMARYCIQKQQSLWTKKASLTASFQYGNVVVSNEAMTHIALVLFSKESVQW